MLANHTLTPRQARADHGSGVLVTAVFAFE